MNNLNQIHKNIIQFLHLLSTIEKQNNSMNTTPFSHPNQIFKESIKIKPLQCYTKIQEAYPAHCSNLINKELGYDSLIQLNEGSQPYKLKNCICSARPNSQLFKRFSKNMIANIKNEVDQMFIFTSMNSTTRLETSIGLETNPGIFLIIGLTFLDQKYKEPYQKCDIQFCFLEFKEGLMYDLLCYTGEPLMPQRETSNQNFINFKEHWVKTTTFNQFIKLFKIALFNNKERDFKSQNKGYKCRSTFIMKVRSKLYGSEGELQKEHETVLIDFQQNCMKQNNFSSNKQKNVKTVLDYILIEVHNSNLANKPIHYHLVQENHLLLLIKKFLNKEAYNATVQEDKKNSTYVGGQITFINSFPADKKTFLGNYSYLQNIQNYVGDPWEGRVAQKIKKNNSFNHNMVEIQLRLIAEGISHRTYSSLRSFNGFKHQLIQQIRKCKQNFKQFRKILNCYMHQKLQLTFLKNQLIAYQIKLIGSCIKSDHFKDFYNAKSYLQLQREITIKTQDIKEQIQQKHKIMVQIYKKFINLHRQQQETYQRQKQQIKPTQAPDILNLVFSSSAFSSINSYVQTKQNWNGKSTEGKFKKLASLSPQTNQLQQLRSLINYLHEYVYSLWDNVTLSDERTVTNNVQLQQFISKQQLKLCEIINGFVEQVTSINETDIMYEQQNNVYNNNQVALFRSLNFLGMLGPKKTINGLEVGKRLMIKTDCKQPKKQEKGKISICSKLPAISSKNIVIVGDLKISSFLANPYENESITDKIIQ